MNVSRSTRLVLRKGLPAAHLYNDTYRFNLYVYWPANLERETRVAALWNQSTPTHNSSGRSYFFSDKEAGRVGLIFLRSWKGSPIDHATLTHEALHIAIDQLTHRGVPISQENDEPLCYLTEWIVRETLTAINQWKRGKLRNRK